MTQGTTFHKLLVISCVCQQMTGTSCDQLPLRSVTYLSTWPRRPSSPWLTMQMELEALSNCDIDHKIANTHSLHLPGSIQRRTGCVETKRSPKVRNAHVILQQEARCTQMHHSARHSLQAFLCEKIHWLPEGCTTSCGKAE